MHLAVPLTLAVVDDARHGAHLDATALLVVFGGGVGVATRVTAAAVVAVVIIVDGVHGGAPLLASVALHPAGIGLGLGGLPARLLERVVRTPLGRGRAGRRDGGIA